MVSNIIDWNYFLYKNIMGMQVHYQILLFCKYFWLAVWQPETLLAYSLTTEYSVRFSKPIDKHYFNVFFFLSHFPSVSISRMVNLKTLVLYIDFNVNWRYQHHWFITIIIIIILILRTCLWRYKMFSDVFECYWYSSSSS